MAAEVALGRQLVKELWMGRCLEVSGILRMMQKHSYDLGEMLSSLQSSH
jgi:hypothetical protein